MPNVANPSVGGLRPFHVSSLRGLMDKRCEGQHDIYVAEVLYVEAEGKMVVATVCRSCDVVNFHEKVIAASHQPATLLKQGK